jgi:cyclase
VDNPNKTPRGKMEKIVEEVYAYLQPFVFYSSNAGLIVGKKESVIVDSLTNQYMVEDFKNRIKEISGNPVRFLINTHPHGDHTYTNHFFHEATVICSSLCREQTLNMPSDQVEKAAQEVPTMSFDGARNTPQDLVFEKTLTLYQDEREIRICCLGPGHSPSDTYIFLPKEKIVFCGDIVFSGTPPLSLAGSIFGHIDQLKVLIDLDASYYVPGHGPLVDKAYISDSRDFLIKLQEEARKCFDKGMTLPEAAKAIDMTSKRWPTFPAFFRIAQCARAYSEFKGEKPGSLINLNLAELVRG